MNQIISLRDLRPGQTAPVTQLSLSGPIRRRLLDLGLIETTRVECVGQSPGGDPAAFLIRGAVIAIRAQDGRRIFVRPDPE